MFKVKQICKSTNNVLLSFRRWAAVGGIVRSHCSDQNVVFISGVERRTSNHGSVFETSRCHFEAGAITLSPRCPSSLKCINDKLLIDISWEHIIFLQ